MKDKLSALMDGELGDELRRPVFDALKQSYSLRTDWETYCLIGDALRGEQACKADFVARVMAGLDGEVTLLAPAAPRPQAVQAGYWRSLMPLAASLMGVAAVGWVAHALYSEPAGLARVASSAGGAAKVADVQMASVRPVSVAPIAADPHREYVFIHQTMTGGGPISGAIQNVRAVSDVRQDAAR